MYKVGDKVKITGSNDYFKVGELCTMMEIGCRA